MTTLNWTDDRVEQLKNLWTEGLSFSHIARAMGGVTRKAVIGKVVEVIVKCVGGVEVVLR